MGVKLMTGATGEQNIMAADDRECLAGITGLDSYVFPTGNRLKATLVDANNVTIGTGAGSLQGSRFRCATTTNVTIQSGTQGQYRRDIIGLAFERDTDGRESMEFQVLTGDPASSESAAADPAYTAGDLLAGDASAFMPLYRIKLSGINAAEPEAMFSVLSPIAELGDSVSPYAEAFIYGKPGDTTYAILIISGSMCTLRWDITQQTQTSWWMDGYTLPERMRPWYGFYAAGSHVDKSGYLIAGSAAYAYVSTDGRINFNVATKVASSRNVGSCTWPMRRQLEE